MYKSAHGLWCTAMLWLLLSTALASTVSPNSWRPYHDASVLVTLGMTKGEVLLKAGQPQSTEVISLGTDGHPSISVWTYLRTGYNAEVATLTFSGHKLTKIELHLV